MHTAHTLAALLHDTNTPYSILSGHSFGSTNNTMANIVCDCSCFHLLSTTRIYITLINPLSSIHDPRTSRLRRNRLLLLPEPRHYHT